MADLRKYTAVKKTRASIGKSIGATTLDVAAIQDRLGNTLTMTNFGSKGFGVISPRKSNERQFVFTGITGSHVTGISEVTMDGSNTETSGWSRAIIAGEEVVLMTNSPAFYNEFPNVNNDNTFVGKQLFTTANRPALTTDSDTSTAEDLVTYGQLSRTSSAGGVNASTADKGLIELGTATEVDAGTLTGGTGAALAVTPDKLRARRYLGYYVDSGSNDTYAVTGVSATLAAGDRILVSVNTANTGAATLSVDGGANIAIVKDKSVALETGDLVADQIIDLIYDGTNWQLVSPVAQMSAANKALLTGGATSNADSTHTHGLLGVADQITPYLVSGTAQTSTINIASTTDGATVYVATVASTTSIALYRFTKDSTTGQYFLTHTQSITGLTSAVQNTGGLLVIGSYLYIILSDNGGTGHKARRVDAADLANLTTLTYSGGTPAAETCAFTNGTDIFILTSANTASQYTISGTTLTLAGTVTYTSAGSPSACFSDNTNVWFLSDSSGTVTIKKYALAGGATVATDITKLYYASAFPSAGTLKLSYRKSGVLQISFLHTIESLSAVISSTLHTMTLGAN